MRDLTPSHIHSWRQNSNAHQLKISKILKTEKILCSWGTVFTTFENNIYLIKNFICDIMFRIKCFLFICFVFLWDGEVYILMMGFCTYCTDCQFPWRIFFCCCCFFVVGCCWDRISLVHSCLAWNLLYWPSWPHTQEIHLLFPPQSSRIKVVCHHTGSLSVFLL